MTQTLKIVIPMAGWGTRMRPQTWSKPKPLVSVAGKTSLEHLLAMFSTLPDPSNTEYIFILGPHLGEQQIPSFIKEMYPNIKVHFVVQHDMRGQSHALTLAREYLHGPMLICFSDTLMETDFSFLANEEADGVAWVMPVPDPRRFGVAELDKEGWVTRFIEKPKEMDNNLVVVGCYYVKNAESFLTAIDEQMKQNLQLKGEFFLTDAFTLMLSGGARMRVHEISTWLDTGTIDATLDTNRALLEKSGSMVGKFKGSNVKIIEPVAIPETAVISDSTIGPYASIGADCRIKNSRIADSILEADCEIEAAALSRSLIGRQAKVQGRGDGEILKLNVGDNSSVILCD